MNRLIGARIVKIILLMLITFSLSIIFNCSSNEIKGRFPLKAGNKWILSKLNDDKKWFKDTVESVKLIRGTQYSIVHFDLYHSDKIYYADKMYLHENQNGDIQRLCIRNSKNLDDINNSCSWWYKKSVAVNDSWNAFANSNSESNNIKTYKITLLSKNDTVKVHDKIYKNCYKYLIEDINVSDSEYYDWVVDGIGFVKTQSQWYTDLSYVLSESNVTQKQ